MPLHPRRIADNMKLLEAKRATGYVWGARAPTKAPSPDSALIAGPHVSAPLEDGVRTFRFTTKANRDRFVRLFKSIGAVEE